MLQICDYPLANGVAVGDAKPVCRPAATPVLLGHRPLLVLCSSLVLGIGPDLRTPAAANDSPWQRHAAASEASHAAER